MYGLSSNQWNATQSQVIVVLDVKIRLSAQRNLHGDLSGNEETHFTSRMPSSRSPAPPSIPITLFTQRDSVVGVTAHCNRSCSSGALQRKQEWKTSTGGTTTQSSVRHWRCSPAVARTFGHHHSLSRSHEHNVTFVDNLMASSKVAAGGDEAITLKRRSSM